MMINKTISEKISDIEEISLREVKALKLEYNSDLMKQLESDIQIPENDYNCGYITAKMKVERQFSIYKEILGCML